MAIKTEMFFEWDIDKETSNIEKHGIDFETASYIFEGRTIQKLDDRFDYREQRYISVGEVDGRVLAVVWTQRGVDVVRIISARGANRNERGDYRAACERGEADPPGG